MRSRREADARPVRTVLNSVRECSTDFAIRSCASLISSSTVAIRFALLAGFDDGSDPLARECGLHTGARTLPLERVLERERVEERCEHARVIRGRTLHPLRRGGEAAVEVPPTDDDRDLDAALVHVGDLPGEAADDADVDAV